MPTYLGRNIVTWPTSPPAPAAIEFQWNAITGETVGTFSGSQQVYDFNAHWVEVSVRMPSMTAADGQTWAAFLRDCHGQACVFTFPSATVALFPVELTTDGTTARYFCLKQGSVRWSVKEGVIYGITFEAREVT